MDCSIPRERIPTSGDIERRTVGRKVQFCHFLMNLFREKADVVLAVTNGEDEKETLRLGAVDFHAFQFCRTAKSRSAAHIKALSV